MSKHELHIAVANAIENILSKLDTGKLEFEIKKDPAAGGNQQLPFFLNDDPKRESKVSNVDILILKKGVVKLACEIEESGFIPTKIFGKVFSTSAARTCRLYSLKEHANFELDKNGVFVEVISSDKMQKPRKKPGNSKKVGQGGLIQKEINTLLSNSSSWIRKYYLLFGKKEDFEEGGRCYLELERIINKI